MSETISSNLYRCVDVQIFTLGGSKDLVYFSDERVAHLLPLEITKVLDSCRTFKTLEEHAQDFCSKLRLGSERVVRVEKLLADFVQTGMLVTQEELLTECSSQAQSMETLPLIATVGIITRDRTAQMERCVVSYIENCRQYGRDNDFVLMDDSEGAEVRNAHRQKLRSLKDRYGVEIRYAGHEEKLRFADALVSASDLPDEVVKFGLFDVTGCGCSIGANRNALLLDTVGDMLLSADDDTVCRLTPHPEISSDVAFFSEVDPSEFWFFADRAAALASTPSVEQDLLALHESLLGKKLGNILNDVTGIGQVLMNEVCPHLYRGLKSGSGTVRATFNGVVGDSGIPTPAGYLGGFEGPTRARLVESEAGYDSAFVSREVMRSAKCPSIYHGTMLMGTVLGIDNRDLLPPFMPVQRNEDGAFGFLLSRYVDHSFFGFLPWAILHAADGRKYSNYMAHAADRILSDVIIFCMASHPPSLGTLTGPQRLQALGAYMIEIGSLALPDFEEFIQMQVSARVSQWLSSHEQIFKRFNGSPDFWARDMRQYIETTQQALESKNCIIAQDLKEGRTDSEVVRLSQRLVFDFGRLLQAWPDMIAGAISLRARGIRVAQPV